MAVSAQDSAEEVEQCEEQQTGVHRGSSSSAPSSPPCCNGAVLLRRGWRRGERLSCSHLPRRMSESDGLETVNVRTSRGTTDAGHARRTTARNIARRAKRRPKDSTPPWWC